MTSRPVRLAFWVVLVGFFPPPGSAQLEASRVAWTRLDFKASKLAISAYSEVTLESAAPSVASAELIAPGDGREGLAPRGAESFLLKLRTRVLGQESRLRFWFDPLSAVAFQRSELSAASKKRGRYKAYRYTPEGVFSLTRRPAAGEAGLSHEKWSDTSDNFDPYPEGLDGETVVTEPSALLYIIPASDLSAPGDELRVHVFAKGRVNPVVVRVEKSERIEADYVEESANGERTVKGKVDALRVVLRPQTPEAESGKSDFRLLGLQGNIDLFLQPETRAPLRVDGNIKVAGGVRLRLQRVVLK